MEEGTPFARWYAPGASPLPSDDSAADMYAAASQTLRAVGYEHYELSNYARPGHRCAHNMAYWDLRPYYAFGVGAASYLAGRRFTRPKAMKQYYGWLDAYCAPPAAAAAASGGGGAAHGASVPSPTQAGAERAGTAAALPAEGESASSATTCASSDDEAAKGQWQGGRWLAVAGGEQPPESREERLLDTVMLRLRLRDGLNLALLGGAYGDDAAATVRRALAAYWMAGAIEGLDGSGKLCGVSEAEVVRLADPQGLLLSNDVISDVFAAFSPDT